MYLFLDFIKTKTCATRKEALKSDPKVDRREVCGLNSFSFSIFVHIGTPTFATLFPTNEIRTIRFSIPLSQRKL